MITAFATVIRTKTRTNFYIKIFKKSSEDIYYNNTNDVYHKIKPLSIEKSW